MADALDLVTLDEAESYMSVASDTQILLPSFITAVSRLIDERVGPVVQRTIAGETHDGQCVGRGAGAIYLKHTPLSSVTSVTEYQGNTAVTLTEETPSTSPGSGFLVDLTTGQVTRRSGKIDWHFWPGRDNVTVTYVAGRYADTGQVDDRFKMAALISIRQLWTREQGMGTITFGPDGAPIMGATFALPNAALAMLGFDVRLDGFA